MKITLANEDKKIDTAIVTSGLFQDGASSITTFFSSSTQYTNTGDYSIDVYRYDPSGNASASVQFGVAYGHEGGSGSLGTKGATGDRTTAAMNRARIREQMEPGGWELHLSGSNAGLGGTKIKLIDDSADFPAGTNAARNFSPEYNIVSGTIAGGTVTAASAEPTNSGSYGTFYPSLGVMLFNAERLAGGPLSIAHVTSSNNDARNNRKFFNAIVQGAYFQAKRREEISSRHIFIRTKADNFNSTTNETFFTESKAGIKQVISGFSWSL